jgi:LPXTG-motif cell wall-anchored protein
MTAPPARQTLAETGTDGSTPLLLAGGLTLVAGGLVFRFGPRRTPQPGH